MRDRYQRLKFVPLMMAFALGLSGELYYPMPGLGVIAFIEIFSYSACMLILLCNWSRMGRFTRRTILWGMAWTFAAAVAGLISGLPVKVCLKEVVICSSSWSIAAVAWYVFRKNARLYLVYLVGAGIGAYIGLYHFKQGCWLVNELRAEEAGVTMLDVMVDKQIFPIYANAIFYGCVLPLFIFTRKMPAFLVMAGCVFSGFYLLINGGSRSLFGFYLVAALTTFAVVYAKRMAKVVMKSKVTLILSALIAMSCIFMIYKFMASSGQLGEIEQDKYDSEFTSAETGQGGFLGRGGYLQALDIFIHEPWGMGPRFGFHSALTSAMAKEGIIGLAFWIYFIMQVIWFVSRRLIYSGKYSAFIMLMLTNAVWAALGSPFGARHIFFVSLAFISLCRDNPLYGDKGVFTFDNRYLSRLPQRLLMRTQTN